MVQNLADRVINSNISNTNYDIPVFKKNPAQAGSQRNITGSLGYSWNIGQFHFVQLNNYPTFSESFHRGYISGISSWDIDIKSSIPWLINDLSDAGDKKIILNWHKWHDLSATKKAVIKSALEPFKHSIIAIFTGHIHSYFGKTDEISLGNITIPIISTGSAIYNRYIKATFNTAGTSCNVTTQVINSFDGINPPGIKKRP